jgi:hypothetical protein
MDSILHEPQTSAATERAAEPTPSAVPAWDSGKYPFPMSLAATCLRTWFLPHRFGAQYPDACRAGSAALFRWLVTIAAVGLLAIKRQGMPGAIQVSLVMGVALLVAAALCETLLGALLGMMLYETQGKEGLVPWRSKDWRRFVGYFRSFLLLTAAAFPTIDSPTFLCNYVLNSALRLFQVSATNQNPGGVASPLIWLPPGVIILYWWVCLCVAIRTRVPPCSARLWVMLAIPLILVVMTIGCGGVASVALTILGVFLIMWMFSDLKI